MNRDDVIRMAREAYGDWYPNAVPYELERFAALIAAAEREACAALVETLFGKKLEIVGSGIAAEIRARGQE